MNLSIVIVNWNTRSLLRACLRSLEAAGDLAGIEHEILVIDNASADGSAEMTRQEFPRVTLIANESNLGYAAATNQGFAAARGESILLLNPDTEVPPGALRVLMETLAAHPDAAAVAPRLVDPDGTVQRSVRGFPAPWALLAELSGLARLFPRCRCLGAYRMRYWNHDDERRVDQPMASCLLIRREALEAVGPMDEEFPIFGNDADWCYRAWAAGWSIYFTPRAEIVHHGGASTSQVRRAMFRETERGLTHFYRKHYRGRAGVLGYLLALAAIHAGTAARILVFDARAALGKSPAAPPAREAVERKKERASP
ncbi:MAG TPA: glycosyltransferase family 2 protein [Armatimonadota bacterium]|nr:glycosyltransferase family 2 protein [Armatimonadota bacterium]HOJ20777.1 glycosyltransferase family 2 protein [Armatimonadota bacterium]HOM82115.1 glycosyltransferase family 2 protein [Armatimonadota bacterium]HOQ27570.1 glycosyltransferase family 2 protein [Armatimonadota bacterium]HPO72060.1 glycosyltransferase family 2 protein [Armatimonadota bacterium]